MNIYEMHLLIDVDIELSHCTIGVQGKDISYILEWGDERGEILGSIYA